MMFLIYNLLIYFLCEIRQIVVGLTLLVFLFCFAGFWPEDSPDFDWF